MSNDADCLSYHVRCNEQPLRQLALSQVLVEHGSILVGHGDVLLVGETLGGGVAVINDSRVVLPDIVIRLGRLVDVALALEARVRHVFLVGTPRDTLVIKQIDNAGDIGRDLLEVVVVTSECVSTDRCNVVRHGRVCHAEVVVNTDALRCKPLQVWVAESIVIVGVLEPDCHEPIKDLLYFISPFLLSMRKLDGIYLALDMRSRLSSLCCSFSSSHIGTLRCRVDVGLCCNTCNGESAKSENVHADSKKAQLGSGNECVVETEYLLPAKKDSM